MDTDNPGSKADKITHSPGATPAARSPCPTFEHHTASNEINIANRIIYGSGKFISKPVKELSTAEMIANLNGIETRTAGIKRITQIKEEEIALLTKELRERINKTDADAE